MKIFLAVLFVCNNDACEFVQNSTVFYQESDCRHSVQTLEIALRLRPEIYAVRGTCVQALIESTDS